MQFRSSDYQIADNFDYMRLHEKQINAICIRDKVTSNKIDKLQLTSVPSTIYTIDDRLTYRETYLLRLEVKKKIRTIKHCDLIVRQCEHSFDLSVTNTLYRVKMIHLKYVI